MYHVYIPRSVEIPSVVWYSLIFVQERQFWTELFVTAFYRYLVHIVRIQSYFRLFPPVRIGCHQLHDPVKNISMFHYFPILQITDNSCGNEFEDAENVSHFDVRKSTSTVSLFYYEICEEHGWLASTMWAMFSLQMSII